MLHRLAISSSRQGVVGQSVAASQRCNLSTAMMVGHRPVCSNWIITPRMKSSFNHLLASSTHARWMSSNSTIGTGFHKTKSPKEADPDYYKPESIVEKKDSHDHLKKPITMDELLKPEGDWQEAYNEQNSRYNRDLGLAVAAFAFTLWWTMNSGWVDPVGPPKSIPKDPPFWKRISFSMPSISMPSFKSTAAPEKSSKSSSATKPKEVKLDAAQIPGLPESVPYLIIGGGTAAFAGMRAIRQNDPKANVLLISDEQYPPYMKPPLSKELWFTASSIAQQLKFTQWNGKERGLEFEHPEFYASAEELAKKTTGGVGLVSNHRVVRVNPSKKTAQLDSGQVIKYGKCLLAVGGEPKSLPVFESASKAVQERVILYRRADDFKRLEELSRTAKSITVVGGGFLGSEITCALGRRSLIHDNGQTIVQIFPESGNMRKVLPEYLSRWTTNRVREEGVTVMPNEKIVSAESSGKQIQLTLSSGAKVLTDYVVVAVGIEPNTDLLTNSENTGIEIDRTQGGIVVNAELEARRDLFVAGDAANFYDPLLGRRRVEHHDHAVVSGRLAGENMTADVRGEPAKPYRHQSMFWSDLGPQVGYEAIGLIDSSLPTVAIFAQQDPARDTPQAQGDGLRSDSIKESSTKASPGPKQDESVSVQDLRSPLDGDNYSKGVVFYLRNDIIVGLVMWNVFNRMPLARRILAEGRPFEDLNEVAKLFALHAPDEFDDLGLDEEASDKKKS